MLIIDRKLIASPSFILLGAAFLLVVIVLVAAVSSFTSSTPPSSSSQTPLPTPTPYIQPITPLPKQVVYDKTATDKMMDTIKNRQPLTASDSAARALLVAQAQKSSYLYTSNNVRLEYVSAPDEFMAEILTSNISGAKNEVVTFLQTKGLSHDAICHLPLVFYFSSSARHTLPSNSPAFSPIAEGC